jgi:hypothetical protein
MRKPWRSAVAAALTLPLLLSGCSLLPTTRKLPIPKPPTMEQTVAPEVLVAQLNQRWEALSSLTAWVEIQASQTKAGTTIGSPALHGNILMRKPEMLRVLGSYLGLRAFDMAGDGKTFMAFMRLPSGSKAVKGSYTLKKKSTNPLENLRPGFFYDAMAVRGLAADDEYMVTADTITVEDAARKHLYAVPEYKLSVMRRKAGSPELQPGRVVYFHRDDLLPYQQDIYDSGGNLETQVFYASYQDFGAVKYPSWVKIVLPQDQIEIMLNVDKVIENQPLTDDQFVMKPPEGTPIQSME